MPGRADSQGELGSTRAEPYRSGLLGLWVPRTGEGTGAGQPRRGDREAQASCASRGNEAPSASSRCRAVTETAPCPTILWRARAAGLSLSRGTGYPHLWHQRLQQHGGGFHFNRTQGHAPTNPHLQASLRGNRRTEIRRRRAQGVWSPSSKELPSNPVTRANALLHPSGSPRICRAAGGTCM